MIIPTFRLLSFSVHFIFFKMIENTENEEDCFNIYTHNHLDESYFSNSFMIFAQLRDEDILTDITLKADDGGLEVCAHKLVLMAASEYFRTMFKSCFCEADLGILNLHGN